MVVLAMVLSLGMVLALPVGAAASQSAINVASYDFNSLTGSDTSPFANLDGQDNWTSNGFIFSIPQPAWYVGITDTLGFDGTQALRFQRIGAGYGADASRLNDATFSIPDFDDADMGFFQADFGIGYWGNEFALAYDAISDGVIRKTDPSEIGPRLLVGSEVNRQIKVILTDGSIFTTSLSNANGAVGETLYGKFKRPNGGIKNKGTRHPTSILPYKVVHTVRRRHRAEKPVDLLKYLIATYTNTGETVLDFTMGSGSTGVAARELKRKFIGVENNQTDFGLAQKRISMSVDAWNAHINAENKRKREEKRKKKKQKTETPKN